MTNAPTGRANASGWYQIRLQGRLDPRWSTRFEGMTLTTDGDDTLITGTVTDQAALHGLLTQLRDLAIPLTAVTRLDTALPDRPPHDTATTTTRSKP